MYALGFIDSTSDMERNFGCSHYDVGFRSLGVGREEEEQNGQCLDGDRCFGKLQGRNFPWEGWVRGTLRGCRHYLSS